jgi:NADPH2:quinone reductase
MKAVLSKVIGGPDALVFEDTPSPKVGPRQVLIAVKAVGVNFPDVLIIEDKYQTRPERPFSPGGEVAGTITAVGEEVTGLKVGDRVLASGSFGGMAEEAAIDSRRVIKIPDSMPFDEAAAFLMTYGTSYYALKRRGRLAPGETLLILGAAGGVGLAAVELGKVMGARVIAACSTQEKVDLTKAHGASDGVIYPSGRIDRDGQRALSDLFKSVTGPKGADVIYDAVGGDYAEPAFRTIAWNGRYLVVGFAAGEIPRLPLNLPLLKGADVCGVFWGNWTTFEAAAFQADTQELLQFYVDGKIKPHVSERFPLAKGADAIRHLASRQAMGKVVVTVD